MTENIYEGIDKKKEREIYNSFLNITSLFNEGDIIAKNLIVNTMFMFLNDVIEQDSVKAKLKEAYDMLE